MININNFEKFEKRHIGPNQDQEKVMLKAVGVDTLDALINETIPANIRLDKSLNLPAAKTEVEYLKHIKSLADKNKVYKSYIGTGYYNCVVPGVIQRNILEKEFFTLGQKIRLLKRITKDFPEDSPKIRDRFFYYINHQKKQKRS